MKATASSVALTPLDAGGRAAGPAVTLRATGMEVTWEPTGERVPVVPGRAWLRLGWRLPVPEVMSWHTVAVVFGQETADSVRHELDAMAGWENEGGSWR